MRVGLGVNVVSYIDAVATGAFSFSGTAGPTEAVIADAAGGFSVSGSATAEAPQGPVGPEITSFTVTDASAGAGRPVTVAVPLVEGDLPQGQSLVVTDAADNPLPTQFDKIASWRTDSSVQIAMVTFDTPAAGDNSGAFKVASGTALSGTPVSKADIVASGFDSVVAVDLGGTVYSLSAADLLSGAVTPLQDYPYLSGPKMSELIIGGHLRENGTGTAHPTLQAYFHVRAFNIPVDGVRLTTVLENTGVNTYSGDLTGDVTISVGGVTQYTNNNFTIVADNRLPKRFQWGVDPQNYALVDVAYMRSTKLFSEYSIDDVDEARLAGFTTSVDWGQAGNVTPGLAGGGSDENLAPFDDRTASYLVTGDKRALDAMEADATVHGQLGNIYGYAQILRHEVTGYPLDLSTPAYSDYTGKGWTYPGDIASESTQNGPSTTDQAHMPSSPIAYFLATGDFYAMEQCQFMAISPWMGERPGSYPGWPRAFGPNGQVRGLAWAFRNMQHGAIVTPDSHPLKSYLDDAVVYALESLRDDARPLDPDDLGLILTEGNSTAVAYPDSDTPNPNDSGDFVGFGPWMQNFLNMSVAMASVRGWAAEVSSTGVLDWLAKSTLELMGYGSGAWCAENASVYAIGIRDSNAGAYFSSWPIIASKNYPSQGACDVSLASGFAVGGDNDARHRGPVLQAALAWLASAGVANATAAYNRLMNRGGGYNRATGTFATIGWSGAGKDSFKAAPEWALEPHDYAGLPSIGAPAYLPGQTFTWARVNQAGSTVEATILADLAGDTGHTDPGNIVGPWSGGTLYMKNGEPHLKVIGGGHGDSSYNGGPGINLALDAPSWFIEAAPSPSSAIIQNSDTYSDGKPSSGHTYNLVTYMNGKTYLVGNTGRFPGTTGTQQIFEYDIASGAWRSRASNPTNYGPDGAVVAVEASGRIWKIGQEQQATGYARLQYWDEATNSWTTAPGTNDSFAMANYVSIAYDPTRNQLFYFSSANGSGYAIYDIDTETEERNFTRTGAFLAAENVMYDSVRDLYIGFNDAATQLYEMSPDARVTTLRALAGTPPQIETVHGHYGRAQFYAPYNAVYLLGSTTGDLKVLEVA